MQSLHFDFAKQKFKNSIKKTNNCKKYSLFRYTNRFDFSTKFFELYKKSIRSNLQFLHRYMFAKTIRTFDILYIFF